MTFGFKNHKFSQEVENTLDGGAKEQQEQMPLFGTQWGEQRRKGSLCGRRFPLTLFVFSWGDKGRHCMRFFSSHQKAWAGGRGSLKYFKNPVVKIFSYLFHSARWFGLWRGGNTEQRAQEEFLQINCNGHSLSGKGRPGKGNK